MTTHAAKPLRPYLWLKRSAIALIAWVIFVALLWTTANQIGKRKLARLHADLRALGLPATPQELPRQAVPDPLSAQGLIVKVGEQIEATGVDSPRTSTAELDKSDLPPFSGE